MSTRRQRALKLPDTLFATVSFDSEQNRAPIDMPVYVVDGIRYRVPLTSIFKPRTLCKDLLVIDAHRVAAAPIR